MEIMEKIKELSKAASAWNKEPGVGAFALDQRFTEAARRGMDLDKLQTSIINNLAVGSAYRWFEMTGEELSPLKEHIMGLALYAEVFDKLTAMRGSGFLKEEWLRYALGEVLEQIGNETVQDLSELDFGNELEQARKRLAAIREGGLYE